MPELGEWSVDHSPERHKQHTLFDIQKPRLSRVQLPTYALFICNMMGLVFVFHDDFLKLTLSCFVGTFQQMMLSETKMNLKGLNGTFIQ